MDRRRQASASASVASLDERYKSSGSATPKYDDDEDAANRRTRGRNPLPPTRGPLFPPLPPKPPRPSPKNSPSGSVPRSPATRPPAGSAAAGEASSALARVVAGEDEGEAGQAGEGGAGGAAVAGAADAADEAEGGDGEQAAEAAADGLDADDKPTLPGTSGTSLTPAPEDGMDVDADAADGAAAPADDAAAPPDDAGRDGGGADDDGEQDWQSYRRHRGVRAFSDAARAAAAAVKVEPEDAGAGAPAGLAGSTGSAVETTTPKSGGAGKDTPRSERATSTGRARKRRGEDQLLLDDHLLPAEIRRLGSAGRKQREEEDEEDEEGEGDEDREQGGDDEGAAAEGEADVVPAPEEEEGEEGDADEGDDDDDDDDGQEVTRCVCRLEDDDIMMIQCDKCNVWQHGGCMGIWGDEEAPDEYFCEECRPELHGPLRKYIRSKGRNIANFVPPSPEELLTFYNPSDKYPPSQSKRWADSSLPGSRPKSRSHHRKEAPGSPEQTRDGRAARARQGPTTHSATAAAVAAGAAAAATTVAAKPVSSGGGKDRRRTHDRRVSLDVVSPPRSPPPRSRPDRHGREKSREEGAPARAGREAASPAAPGEEPKRRSTMNSRDAAYEEAVKAALEASRREMEGKEERKDEGEGEDRKRRREDEDEPTKKGKKRREEAADDAAAASGKPKHPNQYTYRPKPAGAVPAAPSPARRTAAGTPVPTLPPPAHEHGTRRAGAIASNLAAAPYNPASVNNLSWHLPEYLSAHADLLPAPAPVALAVPAPRALAFVPRNHFLNWRYGPFDDARDGAGRLRLPDDGPAREVEGGAETRRDAPARVKYPPKRMTAAEMRKRVRHVLEYVGRVQVEEGRRKERAGIVGIPASAPGGGGDGGANDGAAAGKGEGTPEEGQATDREAADFDTDGDVVMGDAGAATDDAAAPAADAAAPPPRQLSALQLLDELTRDLIAFQESFASHGANGFATPTLGGGAFDTPAQVDVGAMPDALEVPEAAGGAESAAPEAPEASEAPEVPEAPEASIVPITPVADADLDAAAEDALLSLSAEAIATPTVAATGDAGAAAPETLIDDAAPMDAEAEAPAAPLDEPAARSEPPINPADAAEPEAVADADAATEVYKAGEVDRVVPETQEIAAAGGDGAVASI